MKKRNWLFVFLSTLFLVLSFSSFATPQFKEGKYIGSAEGFGGAVKVQVETSKDKILSVTIVEHNESKGISDFAIENMPKAIVENQSLALDYVAGASRSSKAILQATEKALSHSGVSMKELMVKPIKEKELAVQFDTEADVVIIGAGGAGLAAGVSAYENGAKSVIILEKMHMIGGNTIRAGGAMNAVYDKKQKAQGIEDSIEKHFQQTYEGGNKVADQTLVRTLVTKAPTVVDWLESLGLEWKEKMGSVIGSMWPRTHQAVEPLGTGYINTLSKAFEKHGGKIYLSTKAESLVLDKNRVVGVLAQSKDGKTVEFKAKKGVVLASGGYAANVAMVKEYLTDGVYTKDKLPANLETTNHPGSTGEGILMAEKAGADLLDMQHIQLLPMPADRFGPTINVESCIFINKDGKRYVKEDGRRDEICLGTFAQKDGVYYMINDAKIIPADRKTTSGEDLDKLIAKGTVVEANSLEELAKAIQVPAATLRKTVEAFNQSVDKKEDEFGRKIWVNKIDQAPFYATLRFPALYHTMGGVRIDKEAHVLDNKGAIIPGFYAAGEVTGGIHGANRLGGNAIADVMVFGRIAGKNAVLENE